MQVMTRKQVTAAFLGVSLRTLDRFRAKKLIRAFQVGRVVRFRHEDVQEFFTRFLTK